MAGEIPYHLNHLNQMIHLSMDTDTTLADNRFGPLSPVKRGPLSIDLCDLISSKTTHTPSTLSIFDCGSIKADDDMMRPINLSESFSLQSFETIEPIEIQNLDQSVTLGEIISKRSYTRRPKETKKMPEGNTEAPKRRRKQINTKKDPEETIMKKEKLNDQNYKEIVVKHEKSHVPEVIFKDGRVQVLGPIVEGSVKEELEIVQPKKKKITTSTSFKQMTHTEKWTEKETNKFYRALELFGTDFSMIARVFKNRTRNQIKNKFLREEKIAPEKMNDAFKEKKSSKFQKLFSRLERLKKIEISVHQKVTEDKLETNLNENLNLLKRSQPIQNIKTEDLQLVIRERNERSGSFHSATSVDSIDKCMKFISLSKRYKRIHKDNFVILFNYKSDKEGRLETICSTLKRGGIDFDKIIIEYVEGKFIF